MMTTGPAQSSCSCREGENVAARLGHSGRFLLGGRLRQRRSFGSCAHSSTITTITAGLAREVCEACSHVSVRYVEQAVRLYPDQEVEGKPSSPDDGNDDPDRFEAIIALGENTRILGCGLCAQSAVFMTPGGLRCNEHAWQEAALLDWERSEPWVPIQIGVSTL